MKWKQERDLLIAQTMAFVQSVTEQSAFADTAAGPPAAGGSVNVPSPREVIASHPLVPFKQSELRQEIQRRVAVFRARQQVFERDRDEYCRAMLARVRAITEQAASESDRPPIKR